MFYFYKVLSPTDWPFRDILEGIFTLAHPDLQGHGILTCSGIEGNGGLSGIGGHLILNPHLIPYGCLCSLALWLPSCLWCGDSGAATLVV